jgi:rhodanese-related sulfurtransferase
MRIYTKISSFVLIGILIFVNIQAIGQNNIADDYIDISVNEAWDFLNDTSNGIQIPIDVRTDVEWYNDRIDTPYPEFPRHFELAKIQDEESYQDFISLYDGNDVILYCKGGSRSVAAASVLISRGFNGTVYNVEGGITEWANQGLPKKKGNDNPNVPIDITGPAICTKNAMYSFSSSAEDINDDVIRLGFDWNSDMHVDEYSDYFPSGSQITLDHSWAIDGIVEIRVLAEDHVGGQSSFSEPLEILINNAPTKPLIDGPSKGKAGEQYTFTFSATDIDNDAISFFVTWGDGTDSDWIGPYQSGEEITLTHTWADKDTYELKVKAKDSYDAESEEAIFEISMPKTKQFYSVIEYLINILSSWRTLFFTF